MNCSNSIGIQQFYDCKTHTNLARTHAREHFSSKAIIYTFIEFILLFIYTQTHKEKRSSNIQSVYWSRWTVKYSAAHWYRAELASRPVFDINYPIKLTLLHLKAHPINIKPCMSALNFCDDEYQRFLLIFVVSKTSLYAIRLITFAFGSQIRKLIPL